MLGHFPSLICGVNLCLLLMGLTLLATPPCLSSPWARQARPRRLAAIRGDEPSDFPKTGRRGD
jgi:hypothetical protein